MTSPLLVLDVHYLCHRAFHTQGHLSWEGISTGVIFGFLKDIPRLKDELRTDRVAFCFEHKESYRCSLFPGYKCKRRAFKTDKEKEAYGSLQSQIQLLRTKYLPVIGFKNIFCFPGMESDDIMAEIAKKEKGEVILVTADSDLYQCLSPTVSIYNPHKQVRFDDIWFKKIYQIDPRDWAIVKAVAGCSTDNVPGVGGVGEKTALKFLKGELPKTSKAYHSIMSPSGKFTVRRNRQLVELPFEGCPTPVIQKDDITRKGWKDVCSQLGMKSIAGAPPILTNKLGLLDA